MLTEYSQKISSLYHFNLEESIREVTFQVTNDCCCACTYCYEIAKNKEYMSVDTGKQAVDFILNLYQQENQDLPINSLVKGFTFQFIGGEPLMNIKTIQTICDYFVERCLNDFPDLLKFWRISMISNGTYYFNEEVQSFFKKYHNFLSFSITIDGPQELHDKCRIYPNGQGNFKDAYKAFLHYKTHFDQQIGIKITLVPENIKNLSQIIDFFLKENILDIPINCAHEPIWTSSQATELYYELKKIADKLLANNLFIDFSIFNELRYQPKENSQTWCGSSKYMLTIAPNGKCYTCLRFTPISLGGSMPALCIGDISKGLYTTLEEQKIKEQLNLVTQGQIQENEECQKCTIKAGCSHCLGWDYQSSGNLLSRNTNNCWVHRAQSLANVYYWNKFYQKFHLNKKFEMNLPKNLALKIISNEEYELLYTLSKK